TLIRNSQSGIGNQEFKNSKSSSPARLLQLQLDIDEVVRWPGAGVFEGEQVLVAQGDLLHRLVESLLAVALDEEGGVQDHAVADRLVGAGGDGGGLQGVVDIAYVAVAGLLEGSLDESAELHAGEVGRALSAAIDLVLEAANLFVLLLDGGDDLLPV